MSMLVKYDSCWFHLSYWNIYIYIWSNYSDLTWPHPKWWFSKGNPLISGKSRLVKCYNLARYMHLYFVYIYIYTYVCLHMYISRLVLMIYVVTWPLVTGLSGVTSSTSSVTRGHVNSAATWIRRNKGPLHSRDNTPQKTNMEPKNWWFVDVFPFPRGLIRFQVRFQIFFYFRPRKLTNASPKKGRTFNRKYHLNQPLIFGRHSLVFRGLPLWKLTWLVGKSPLLIGDISSNGCFSMQDTSSNGCCSIGDTSSKVVFSCHVSFRGCIIRNSKKLPGTRNIHDFFSACFNCMTDHVSLPWEKLGVSPRSSIEKNANGFRVPGSNISHQAPSFSKLFNIPPTVDGSEIRRSPVEVGSLSHYVHGFFTYQVVVWDFWTINSITDATLSEDIARFLWRDYQPPWWQFLGWKAYSWGDIDSYTVWVNPQIITTRNFYYIFWAPGSLETFTCHCHWWADPKLYATQWYDIIIL